MTARIGPLPKGDADGTGVIIRDLIDKPHRYHVLLCVVDCSKVTTDHDTGEHVPTIRVRRAEVITRDDLPAAEKLIRRALEKRSGATVLPLEIEDEITAAFAGVDPDTGEVYAREDDAAPGEDDES